MTVADRRRALLGRWGIPLLGLLVALIITGRAHWYFIRPFATPVNMDEGYCTAMALRMIRGHWLPYVDGVSQRGPILYWLYALTLKIGGLFSWTAVRWMGMLFGFAITTLVFALGAVTFSPMAGAVGALAVTYFLTYELAPWDGLGFNGETVAVTFALASALIIAHLQRNGSPRRTRLLAIAGFLFACAGLSKQMFLIHGAPIGLWILLGPQHGELPSLRARVREALVFVAGFAVPYVLVLGLYAATGNLGTFFYYYQRYGREIFMDPLTADYIRDKVREQIDRYFIGVAGLTLVWFFALARALRQTMTPTLSATDEAPEGAALTARSLDAGGASKLAPEAHVGLNLLVPGLGLALVPRRRGLGVLGFVAVVGLLIARAVARASAHLPYTIGSATRDVFFWLAGGLVIAVATGLVLHRDAASRGETLAWSGAARIRANAPAWYALVHMLCAFIGAVFTFRFFPHYFVQVFPFAAVVIAGVVAASFASLDARDRPGLVAAFTLIVGATIILAVGNSALQRNVRMRREADRWYQDPRADPIVRYVAEHTSADQKIFVWGFRAETYLSSRRFPGSRFVYTVYPAGVVPWFQATHDEEERRVVPGSRQQLLDDLEREQPELVIDAGRSMNGRYMYNYPQLRAYLDRHYCFMRYVDGEPVYRRRHGERCPPADY